jgi:hypothetical protein
LGDIPQTTGRNRISHHLVAAGGEWFGYALTRDSFSAWRRTSGILWTLLMFFSASGVWAAAPVVDNFSSSTTVIAPGGVVTLEVSAHDPDCPSACLTDCGLYIRSDLTAWSANDGAFVLQDNGASGSPYTATAQWQAPLTEATYTISVSLSDSGGMLCGGRQSAIANVLVQVTSTPNAAPVIDFLVADPVAFHPGESSQMTCTATDPDGDPVTYGWATDLGTLTPGSNGSATLEAPIPGSATVTCTATDPAGAAAVKSVVLAVSDVEAERMITAGLSSPHRLDVDSMGDLFVVDRGSGGITAIRLETGDLMYRIPFPNASAVAVDWEDQLLVGSTNGAVVVDRAGNAVLNLWTGLGEVSDVAVDLINHRYVSLYRKSGRIVVHDEFGAVVKVFGATGDEPAQLMGPSGVGVMPNGNVAVADSGHGQIKVFDLDGDLVRAIGGAGGSVGQFVELDDVAVGPDGVIYASDSYQDWIQTFNPDGTLREVIGSYGEGLGEFKTAAGVVPVAAVGKLVAVSVNTPGVQVFQLGSRTPVDWPSPLMELSSNTITFSNQEVGTASGPLDVFVTNNGDSPLGIHETNVVGPFAVVNGCGVIDPGEWCAFSVVFTAVAAGPSQGSLTFQSSADVGQHTVSLFGSGFVPAQVVLSATRLDFEPRGVGATGQTLPVIMSNSGTVPLAIAGIVGTGPFGVSSNCGSQLAGGDSCTLAIDFTPSVTGPAVGSVTVASSDVGGPSTIAVSGEGILLELTPDPTSLDFGLFAGGDVGRTEQIQILNTGSGQMKVGVVDLVGESVSDFHVTTDYCSGNPIDVGQSCWIEVKFTPGSTHESVAQLVIPTAAGLEFAVSLSGGIESLFVDGFETGDTSEWVTSEAKGLQVAPTSILFSQFDLGTEVGSRAVTIRNNSKEATYLGALWIQGDDALEFAIDFDSCSSQWLEAGQSCTIGLTMLTMNEGNFSAVLVIPASAAEKRQPRPVSLTGTVRWP